MLSRCLNKSSLALLSRRWIVSGMEPRFTRRTLPLACTLSVLQKLITSCTLTVCTVACVFTKLLYCFYSKGSERIHWTSFDPLKFLTEILPNETRMDLSQMDSMIAKVDILFPFLLLVHELLIQYSHFTVTSVFMN